VDLKPSVCAQLRSIAQEKICVDLRHLRIRLFAFSSLGVSAFLLAD